jgi:hypothetical protein
MPICCVPPACWQVLRRLRAEALRRASVVAAYNVGNAYMRSLQRISRAPANGISQGSTCIQAFLSILRKSLSELTAGER